MIEKTLSKDWLLARWEELRFWLEYDVLVWSTLIQFGVIVVAMLIAWIAARPIESWLKSQGMRRERHHRLRRIAKAMATVMMPFIWLAITFIATMAAAAMKLPRGLLDLSVSLIFIWIVIRLTTNLVRNPVWARFVAFVAFVIAALNATDFLGPTVEFLDSLSLNLGSFRLSALLFIEAFLALAILLWVSLLLSRVLEKRIRSLHSLTPSAQVLFTKLLRIVLVGFAVVLALNMIGLNLSTFAFLAGAIGVGIGFGLQKIVSNFVSGIILLMDRSIKPGDVITVGDTFGWVSSLGARYTSVTTRDGTEHLIPNETLITERVENWSHSNETVRFKIPVGISYSSDVRKARDLAVEAANEHERVLGIPKPICHLVSFGDNSIDLELRVWIKDPQQGVTNILSNVRLTIWELFGENGIEFPFPQRDIHLRSADPAITDVLPALADQQEEPSDQPSKTKEGSKV